MRPLFLTMRAFGPFLDEQQIDFAGLGGSFFLIQGPTGAGKTSILDAMCYALYGRSTGDRDTYRSHHAGSEAETRVEFIFALGQDVFRAERRLTKKGTVVPQLDRRRGDGWEILISRKDISKKIEELLGFNLEQFRRVVMLPQGQFARFLLAPSGEKEGILNSLFRTGRYEEITEQLNQMQLATGGRMKSIATARETVLDQHGGQSPAELEARLPGLAEERGASLTAIEQASAELTRIELTLDEAKETQRRLEELHSAEGVLQLLEKEAEDHSRKVRALDLADRAASLEEILQNMRESAASSAHHLRAWKEAEDQAHHATAALKKCETANKEDVANTAERDRLRLEVDRLRRAEPELRDTLELEGKLQGIREIQNRQKGDLLRCEHTLNTARTRLMEGEARITEFREKAGLVPGMQAERERLERVLRLLQQEEQCSREATRLQEKLESRLAFVDQRKECLEQKRQALRQLLQEWQDSQITHLAAGLKPGAACPVCGSTNHPMPAVADPLKSSGGPGDQGQAIDRLNKEIESEQVELERLQADLRDLEKDLFSQRDRADHACRERIQSDPEQRLPRSSAELFSLLNHLSENISACQAAGLELDSFQKERAADGERSARAERERDELQGLISTTAQQIAHLESSVAERRRLLPGTWGDPAELSADLTSRERCLQNLESRSAELQQAYQAATTSVASAEASLAAAGAAAQQAGERARASRARFLEALTGAGFSDEQSFQASRLDRMRRDGLRGAVEDYARRRQVGEERVVRARADVADRTILSLPSLEKEKADISAAHDAAKAALWEVDQRIRALKQALSQLDALDRDQAALRGDWQLVSKLYEAASGRTGRKITLQRYVLAYRLEEVLGRASERLRRMTQGRFALRRAGASTDGRRTAGLDLEIFDFRTGTMRPVSSLSGGESFLASLSLALALAEVVQARTGGIRLDTIFIDEGFGSLDPEALDLAISTLKRLQEGGRMVGIISHVEELKNQIAAQIEVRSGPAGSSVHVRR